MANHELAAAFGAADAAKEQDLRGYYPMAARVLAEEGFLGAVKVEAREGRPALVMAIRYDEDGKPFIDGIRRVSRPGRRVYVGHDEIPKVRSGLGVAIVSTSRGVLSDRAAREAGVGGEVLCEVW